jgi:hypothetical protein
MLRIESENALRHRCAQSRRKFRAPSQAYVQAKRPIPISAATCLSEMEMGLARVAATKLPSSPGASLGRVESVRATHSPLAAVVCKRQLTFPNWHIHRIVTREASARELEGRCLRLAPQLQSFPPSIQAAQQEGSISVNECAIGPSRPGCRLCKLRRRLEKNAAPTAQQSPFDTAPRRSIRALSIP